MVAAIPVCDQPSVTGSVVLMNLNGQLASVAINPQLLHRHASVPFNLYMSWSCRGVRVYVYVYVRELVQMGTCMSMENLSSSFVWGDILVLSGENLQNLRPKTYSVC
jgi:hypothetical protein